MLVTQYFVEFLFYSFLGWVWESIYCTIKNKEWADRGFLFGPICPIYGSCVLILDLVYDYVPGVSDPDFPLWGIFLICMIGSAIAEFGTSWVLETRFHARWWDYSKVPLNIQGRICLPISIAFGLAGVLVTQFLLPGMGVLREAINPILYEILAIIGALLFGADYALTEASLSTLLKDMDEYKSEFNRRAEATYTRIASTPGRIEASVASARDTLSEGVAGMRENIAVSMDAVKANVQEDMNRAVQEYQQNTASRKLPQHNTEEAGKQDHTGLITSLSDEYAKKLNFNERRILGSIQSFTKRRSDAKEEQKISGLSSLGHLKASMKRIRLRKKDKAS